MRLKCCTAAILRILLAVTFFGAICGGEARAESGLSLGVRVQQEFYTPLVPVTRNFRTCFHMDENGDQVMGICTDADQPAAAGGPGTGPEASPERVPAAQVPSGAPHARPSVAPAKPRGSKRSRN